MRFHRYFSPRLRGAPIAELLRDQVYAAIKRDILQGVHHAGQQLSANELAKKYETSATPVRQALNALHREGLVQTIPRTGYFVTQLTVKDIREIYELRIILEAGSAELAAERITDQELERLEELPHVYEPGDVDSYLQYVQANREFHYGVARATGNARLMDMVKDVLDEIQRLVFLGVDIRAYRPDMIQHHPEVLEALKARDPERAREVMVQGLEKARDAVLASVMRGAELTVQFHQ